MAERAPRIDVAASARLRLPSIADSVVVVRTSRAGVAERIAYVVPSGSFVPEAIDRLLGETVPPELRPTGYVGVSELPLTATGAVDVEALCDLPVIDAALAEACTRQLRDLPQVAQAVARCEELVRPVVRHHLADLLPVERLVEAIPAAAVPPVEPAPGAGAPPPAAAGGHQVEPSTPGNGARRSSVSHGADLTRPVPRNLVAALIGAAAETDRGVIFVTRDGAEARRTYPELVAEARRILGGLRGMGAVPGDTVILQLADNRDLVPAFWACQLGGLVVVPVGVPPAYRAQHGGAVKLHHAWQLLGRPIVVTSQASVPDIAALWTELASDPPRLAAIETLRAHAPDAFEHHAPRDAAALLLLTSGSTGMPKAVRLTHHNVLSRSAATAQMNGFTSADRSLNWFPLDHVGGIVMCHVLAVYLGADQVQASTDYVLEQPTRWLDLIERHRATSTWAPNFAFGLVCEREADLGRRRRDLSSMRFILNGGEAVVAATARRFLRALAPHGMPGDVMRPAWGMSETSSGVTFSHHFAEHDDETHGTAVEVGAPVPGVSIRIVDQADVPVVEGEVGRLQVMGPPVTSGYVGNPQLTAESFSADGWFNTGDLGVLRDGRLTISGRTKDVIIVNGVNLSSHEIEAVVEDVPGVNRSFTAACAVRLRDSDTDRTCVFFNPSSADWPARIGVVKAVREALVAAMGLTPDFVIPVEQAAIPKTAIGKIQRAQLRARFEAGEFDAVVKRVDLDTGNQRTLPDWFFEPSWVARALGPVAAAGRASYLVFEDDQGLAASVRAALGDAVTRWVTVTRGREFARLAAGAYRIDPAKAADYQRLLAGVAAEAGSVDHVLHLWGYGADADPGADQAAIRRAQYDGVFSLLFLARALIASQPPGRPTRITLVTRHAQAVSADGPVAAEKATVIGLLKSLASEEPTLTCAHVDFDGASTGVDAAALARELSGTEVAAEVAFRDGLRLVPVLIPADLSEPAGPLPLVDQGVFLVTGGLGGLGFEVARYLVTRHRAKVLLVGRTALSEATNADPRGAARLRRLHALEAAARRAEDVQYRALDLSDAEALRGAIGEAERTWGRPIDGAFHLAGSVGSLERHGGAADRHWVRAEREETFDLMFQSKVYGTQSLFACLTDRPDTLVVAFSSVNGLFGGTAYSAYSAANRYLDAACHQRRRTHPRTFSFSWTMWDELGMSEGAPSFARDASRALGYRILSRAQGLHSLLAGLCRRPRQLVVGLDQGSRNVRRHLRDGLRPVQQVAAYCTLADAGPASAAPRVDLPSMADRFGTAVTCPVTVLAARDWQPGGPAAPAATGIGADRPAAAVPPRTPVEERLARIWRELLAAPELGIHETFFELGGDSLLAIRLLNRLRETFAVDVTLRTIFERPTIALLAETLPDDVATDVDVAATAAAEPPATLDVSSLDDAEVEALLKRLSAG